VNAFGWSDSFAWAFAESIADPGLTPGFEHVGDMRPIESFYEVPADRTARSCCHRAVVVSSFEFVQETSCVVHGKRSGRVPD
jgi:hypothetical protein